jgi:hypothetical protein
MVRYGSTSRALGRLAVEKGEQAMASKRKGNSRPGKSLAKPAGSRGAGKPGPKKAGKAARAAGKATPVRTPVAKKSAAKSALKKVKKPIRKAVRAVESAIGKAASKVKRAAKKIQRAAKRAVASAKEKARVSSRRPAKATTPAPAPKRPPQPASPPQRVPLGGAVLPLRSEDEHTPQQRSTHAPFRSGGPSGRDVDQELPAELKSNDQFSDEDHFTNRSGDPRIGTHNRSHEPAVRDVDDDEMEEK